MGPYTRYSSSCGALVRPSGKTEESLIPNNHSTLLVLKKEKKGKKRGRSPLRWKFFTFARTYDEITISRLFEKRFPVVETPYKLVFRRFGGVSRGVLAIFHYID